MAFKIIASRRVPSTEHDILLTALWHQDGFH